jgi:hypothetical protein
MATCQRITAAVVGGYALAVGASTSLSLILPMDRAAAVLTGLLVSFLLYMAAILWAFSVGSLRRMWRGLGGATVILALTALLSLIAAP